MKYLILFLVLITLNSCADLKRKDQLKQLSEVEKSLDSIQTVLIETFDVDEFVSILDLNQELSIKIKENTDTISVEFALVLDDYNNVFRNKSDVRGEFNILRDNLLRAKLSIHNLQSDIEEGEGQRGEYNDFVKFEQQKVQTLRNDLTTFIQLYNPFIELHEKYYSKIDSFYNLAQ